MFLAPPWRGYLSRSDRSVAVRATSGLPFPSPKVNHTRGSLHVMGRSDSLSAAANFASRLYVCALLFPARRRASPVHTCTCATFRSPYARRSLGAASKFFTPSMAFAQHVQARLLLGPVCYGGTFDDAAGFALCCRLSLCSHPIGTLSQRFGARIPLSASCQLRGGLALTPTGLPPASRCVLGWARTC